MPDATRLFRSEDLVTRPRRLSSPAWLIAMAVAAMSLLIPATAAANKRTVRIAERQFLQQSWKPGRTQFNTLKTATVALTGACFEVEKIADPLARGFAQVGLATDANLNSDLLQSSFGDRFWTDWSNRVNAIDRALDGLRLSPRDEDRAALAIARLRKARNRLQLAVRKLDSANQKVASHDCSGAEGANDEAFEAIIRATHWVTGAGYLIGVILDPGR